MGYTPQQIGWSVEAKLLHQILQKLDAILRSGVNVNTNTPLDVFITNTTSDPVPTDEVP